MDLNLFAFLVLGISVGAAVASLFKKPDNFTEPQMRLLMEANNERAAKLMADIERRDNALERLSQEVNENKEGMLELQNSLLSARLEIEILKGLIYQHLGEEKARHALAGVERTKRAVNPPSASTPKNSVIKLIEDGYLERAIETAIGLCHGCEYADELTGVSARYSDLQRAIINGNIANPDATRERNSIRIALLSIVREMEA